MLHSRPSFFVYNLLFLVLHVLHALPAFARVFTLPVVRLSACPLPFVLPTHSAPTHNTRCPSAVLCFRVCCIAHHFRPFPTTYPRSLCLCAQEEKPMVQPYLLRSNNVNPSPNLNLGNNNSKDSSAPESGSGSSAAPATKPEGRDNSSREGV